MGYVSLIDEEDKQIIPEHSFNDLIKYFLSDSFKLTEANLYKFLNTLHNLDTELKFARLYTIKTVDYNLVGGNINFNTKEIEISISSLINLGKNASKETIERYKLDLLDVYFHETRHEKQMEECNSFLYDMPQSESAFSKVFCEEHIGNKGNYDVYNSLIEIDARISSLKRIYNIEKSGLHTFSAKSCEPIMRSIVNILDGINNIDKNSYYQSNAFSPEELLKRITSYDIFTNGNKFIDFKTKDFKQQFIKEYNNKILSFFQNEYVYFINNVFINTKISDETKQEIKNIYKLNFFNTEIWNQIIQKMCKQPKRNVISKLYDETNNSEKDINDLDVTKEELIQYFHSKGKEFNSEEFNKMLSVAYEDIKFEKWLKNKRENENNKERS